VAEVIISPRSRPQSPPIPAVDLQRRPALNGFTRDRNVMNGNTEPSSSSSAAPAVPSIGMADAQSSETTGTSYDDLNGELYTLEQAVTPPPEIPLRQKLIGTWKLESYTAYPTPTSAIQRATYPMTKNVTGFIMYTPDGYMSAQFLIPGQQSFRRGTGEEAQWAEAGKRFFAYSGPYYISNEGLNREEILRHTFQVCNLPGWIGDIQIRTCRFEENGEVLVLGSEEPTEIKVSSTQLSLYTQTSLCFRCLSGHASVHNGSTSLTRLSPERQANTRTQVAASTKQRQRRTTSTDTADQN
jgi:hypothetical protein